MTKRILCGTCAAIAMLAAALAGPAAAASDEPDLIFRKSTVWKMLTPDDKLATYAIDDPGGRGRGLPFHGA